MYTTDGGGGVHSISSGPEDVMSPELLGIIMLLYKQEQIKNSAKCYILNYNK